MLTTKTDYQAHMENSFALAIAVLRERLVQLSKADQNDLYELLPVLLGPEGEEQERAIVAVHEIMDQGDDTVEQMELPDGPDEDLKNWTQFVSGRIRAARKEAGLTQEQVAEAAGLPQSHISRIETGQHSPNASTLEKIAKALDVPTSHFDPSS